MAPTTRHADLHVSIDGTIATVEIRRPPHNYFDLELLDALADCYEDLDRGGECRAIILASEGKAFCAGANHGAKGGEPEPVVSMVSRAAIRLFRTRLPVVAAVQGMAVGGGMGLALSADFRVVSEAARFWPNFSRLGFHAGFGLSVTLPRLVGDQRAAMLLYTGRRVGGEEAATIGLADVLAPAAELRARARALAEEIASSAPLAVQSMRQSLRRGLADQVEAAMDRELLEQTWQRRTADFAEGVKAMAERRAPAFSGR